MTDRTSEQKAGGGMTDRASEQKAGESLTKQFPEQELIGFASFESLRHILDISAVMPVAMPVAMPAILHRLINSSVNFGSRLSPYPPIVA